MTDKVAEVRRLIAAGYELEAIESDMGVVEATFYRGGRRARLRFFPSEAERLLQAPLKGVWIRR